MNNTTKRVIIVLVIFAIFTMGAYVAINAVSMFIELESDSDITAIEDTSSLGGDIKLELSNVTFYKIDNDVFMNCTYKLNNTISKDSEMFITGYDSKGKVNNFFITSNKINNTKGTHTINNIYLGDIENSKYFYIYMASKNGFSIDTTTVSVKYNGTQK